MMRVEFHSSQGDALTTMLLSATHDLKAGGWIPRLGEHVILDRLDWEVTQVVWDIQNMTVQVWLTVSV